MCIAWRTAERAELDTLRAPTLCFGDAFRGGPGMSPYLTILIGVAMIGFAYVGL
jgi:hypothetical protein